jgi:P27 family predicted phage terminase small subunit
MNEFSSFLSPGGEKIFESLRKHCRTKMKMEDVDDYELAMLANSFAMYSECAKYCSENGIKMTIITEKGGEYSQICPEYSVMKNEYQNILKHSGKFGLNPADRSKILGVMKSDEKPKGSARFSNLSKAS